MCNLLWYNVLALGQIRKVRCSSLSEIMHVGLCTLEADLKLVWCSAKGNCKSCQQCSEQYLIRESSGVSLLFGRSLYVWQRVIASISFHVFKGGDEI